MNHPTNPSAPPSMQPWQQQQQQQQHPSYPHPPQAWQSAPFGMPNAPSRNVGLIVGGAILVVIGMAAGFVFFNNLHTYLTIEDRFANDPLLRQGTGWVVQMVKEASMKRMFIFGPVTGLFGLGGLVLGLLGLRKK